MIQTDIKTAVKCIAKVWKNDRDTYEREKDKYTKDLCGISMLNNRYALEYCGLTLEEIISLGEAKNIDIAVDELFSKNQVTHQHIQNEQSKK